MIQEHNEKMMHVGKKQSHNSFVSGLRGSVIVKVEIPCSNTYLICLSTKLGRGMEWPYLKKERYKPYSCH